MTQTFTRYTEKDGNVKLFDGRTKVHEFEPTAAIEEVLSLADDHITEALNGDTPDDVTDGPRLNVFLDAVALLDDYDAEAADSIEYSGNVVPKRYKDKYGKKQNCGDLIAEAITTGVVTLIDTTKKSGAAGKPKKIVNPESLAKVQEANGVDGQRWAHLNPGMQVMNTSNVIRGMFWRGEAITVFKLKLDLTAIVKKAKKPGEELKAVLDLGFKPNAKQIDALATLYEVTHETTEA